MSEIAIPILRVDDADAAVAWYERLGLTKQWEHRFEPELPAFVEVARGEVKPEFRSWWAHGHDRLGVLPGHGVAVGAGAPEGVVTRF